MCPSSHIDVRMACFEVGASSRAFDDALDQCLYPVPIIVRQGRHLNAKVSGDVLDHSETHGTMDQAYGNPNTPESACAPDAMEVDLRVSFASTIVGKILFDVSGGAV